MNILDEAKKVREQRQVAYDKPEDNFQRIANLWNAYMDGKESVTITPEDVAMMMMLVKMAREMWQHNPDNAIDIAGYADCLYSIQENKRDRENS